MVVTPYQIVVPIVGVFAIFYAWNLVVRGKKTMWEAILWTLFWGVLVAIALQPTLLDILTTITGIRNRENAVLVTSIGILFFIVFYLVLKLEEISQRQVKMVRQLALREAGLLKNDSSDS